MAVLGWASPSGLAAQRSASTLSGDTITLSLDDALSIAEAHNPAYQKAVNITRENGADMRQAWFNQVLPQARLNLFGTQYLGRLIHVGTDFYGNPVARPVANWIYSSSTNQSVQLNWTIEGASILNALRSQRLTNAGRDVDKAAALTTTRIEVERRYMDALGQRELLEAEEELLASRRIDEEVTKRLFSLAQGSQVDVLKAELDVQTQTQAVQQQRATFGKALLDLRTELGDPGLQPFRLDSVALPIFDPSSLEADALVAVALQRNPDVEKAKSAVDLAQVSMSEGRDSWWPTLNMSAYLGRTAQSSQTGAVFNGAWTEPVDKNFSVSLSFPMLNNFFGTRQRQVQASVNLDNAKEDARQQRLTTEQNVRSDLLDLRSRWSALQVANTSAGIAAKAVELARAQYRMGTIDFQGLRTSINDDANVRRSLITARQAFVDALLSLEAAVGTPVGPTSPGGGDAPGGR
jgi:outer membrane protein TolC